MKKGVIFIIALLMTTLISGCEGSTAVIGTYVWDTKEYINSADESIEFLKENGVSEIYLYFDLEVETRDYENLILNLNSENIKAYAVLGDPSWVKNPKAADTYLNKLSEYQNSSEYKFNGIHLDYEFYLSENNNKGMKAFLEVLKKAASQDTTLQTVIPFWYDDLIYGSEELLKGIFEASDEVFIMAYRNFTDGDNGIKEIVSTEFEYAKDYNKKITIVLETNPSEEGDHISFHELRIGALYDGVSEINKYYRGSSVYKGCAVHHLDTWMEMENRDY